MLLFILLSASQPTAAAGGDFVGEVPSWVVDAAVPAPRGEASGGVEVLLIDLQVDWRKGMKQLYMRYAQKVTGREGLEGAAAISETFDPSHETLRFTHIRVTRGGEILDLTRSTEIEAFRQEQDLPQGIVDGELTAHANLKDIRVGDVIDYAVIITIRPKIAGDHFSGRFRTATSSPVGYFRSRLTLHGGAPLDQRSTNGQVLALVAETGDSRVYEHIGRDVPPVLDEEDMPPWIAPWPLIDTSTMASWGDLTAELAPDYDPGVPLPEAFASQVDAIAAAHAAPEARMTHALRLVQEQIRYVGIEIGKGSFIPRRPDDVVASGYGDCKDKALLLAAALRRLGIEARVALVSLEQGPGLIDRPPSAHAFDHAITMAVIGGRNFWLDPTGSHQGGVGRDLVTPNYAYGLPVVAGSDRLLPITPTVPNAPSLMVYEEFEVPEDVATPIGLTVTSVFKADEADVMRSRIAASSRAALTRRYGDYYGKIYPGTATQGLIEVSDDLDQNEIRTVERYVIDREELAAGVDEGNFWLQAAALDDVLPTPSAVDRHTPIQLSYPRFLQHVIAIRGPSVRMANLDPIRLDNDYFEFNLTSDNRTGEYFTATWMLRGKQPAVPVAHVRGYLRDAKTATAALSYGFALRAVLGGKRMDSFPGDPDTSRPPSQGVNWSLQFSMMLFAGGIAFTVAAASTGINADNAYAAQGTFYPVSLGKFLVLGFTTSGLYIVFWMWKCYRWRNRYEGGKAWAFWRGLFYFVWLYPLFRDANRRNQVSPVAPWLGVAGAILTVVCTLGGVFIPGEARAIQLVATLLVVLCTVPTVMAINRLHHADHVALVRNSRFTAWNIVGMILGSAAMIVLTLRDHILPVSS